VVRSAFRKGALSVVLALSATRGGGVVCGTLVLALLAASACGGGSGLYFVASAPVFLAASVPVHGLKRRFTKKIGRSFVNNIKFSVIPLTISVECSIIMATIFPWRKNK
jgi:hypothetical protein